MSLACRCRDCGAPFTSARDWDQCPVCQAHEAAILAAAARATLPAPDPPRRWSRAWMREYLGVTGNHDD